MRREQVALMMLASANGRTFTPAQIQKALFLLSRESPELFSESPGYTFRPYDYGPFDSAVYDDIDSSVRRGNAEIIRGWVRSYRATAAGVEEGKQLLEKLDEEDRDHVRKVSDDSRGLVAATFGGLAKVLAARLNLGTVAHVFP
jgi:uncharacterized protein